MIKYVKITLRHDGCWSNLTSDIDESTITSLKLYSHPEEDYNIDNVIIKAENKNDFLNLYKNITKTDSIKYIYSFDRLNTNKNNYTAFLSIKGKFEGTITSIMYKNNIPYYSYYSSNGLEHWFFYILNYEQLKQIKKDLKNYATIKNIEIINDDSRMLLNIQTNIFKTILTKKQYELLNASLQLGYFEVPRTITSQELAKTLNISQTTFNKEVNYIIKKIIDQFYSRT